MCARTGVPMFCVYVEGLARSILSEIYLCLLLGGRNSLGVICLDADLERLVLLSGDARATMQNNEYAAARNGDMRVRMSDGKGIRNRLNQPRRGSG